MNKVVEFMASFETYQIGKSIKFARSYNHLRIIVSNDTTNFKYIYILVMIICKSDITLITFYHLKKL